MKRILLVLALSCAACTTAPPAGPAHAPLEHASAERCVAPDAAALAAVVRVSTVGGGAASGVIIGDGLVLTAAHVVSDAVTADVVLHDQRRTGSVVAVNRTTDLALVRVPTENLRPLDLSGPALGQRERVWAVGYPYAMGQQTSDGMLSRHERLRLVTTAGIHSGVSGGGLLRCHGGNYELAGMMRSYAARWVDGKLVRVDNLSIAVPADEIRAFVRATGSSL